MSHVKLDLGASNQADLAMPEITTTLFHCVPRSELDLVIPGESQCRDIDCLGGTPGIMQTQKCCEDQRRGPCALETLERLPPTRHLDLFHYVKGRSALTEIVNSGLSSSPCVGACSSC